MTSKTAPSPRSVGKSNLSAFIGVHRRLKSIYGPNAKALQNNSLAGYFLFSGVGGGERAYPLFTAFKMYRREHERSSAESEAGAAVSNRLMQDVRRGISDKRNRGDRGQVRERGARLFGDHFGP